MDEEMRFHLEMQIEQNLAAGMSPEKARLSAQRQFGNQTWLKELSREMWSMRSIETLIQDLRFGARMLVTHMRGRGTLNRTTRGTTLMDSTGPMAMC
jgi:hypothetical protein